MSDEVGAVDRFVEWRETESSALVRDAASGATKLHETRKALTLCDRALIEADKSWNEFTYDVLRAARSVVAARVARQVAELVERHDVRFGAVQEEGRTSARDSAFAAVRSHARHTTETL